MTAIERFLDTQHHAQRFTLIRDRGGDFVTFDHMARKLIELEPDIPGLVLKVSKVRYYATNVDVVRIRPEHFDRLARGVLAKGYSIAIVQIEPAKPNDPGRQDGRIARSA